MTQSGPDGTGAVPLHVRSIEYQAFDAGDALSIVGRLRDSRPWAVDGSAVEQVHDMELRVTVAVADLTITESDAVMHSLESRLEAVKACGLDCVQLSMDCAGLPDMPEKIPPQLARQIREQTADRGVTIASVQGTFNMTHPDAAERQAGLRRLRVLAQACTQLGTSKIHICTGTRDTTSMWRRHPDNDLPSSWRDMIACVREATEIARDARVVLAFEPEVNNVVDSAQKARRLLIAACHACSGTSRSAVFSRSLSASMTGQILLAWLKLLALDGDLAKAEPKTLRRPRAARRRPAGPRRTETAPENPGDLAMG